MPLFVVGITNSALPFCLLTYAALFVSAGTDSILNATTPLWTAIVAYVWLRAPLTKPQALGLALGFAGVVVLAGSAVGAGTPGASRAIAAAMLATLSYGFAAHYSKRKLANVRPFVSAFGSQLFAAVALVPLALPMWPHGPVQPSAWIAVVLLGAICTAVAYLLYFGLIRNAGAQYAASVTFLIPIFGVVWGAIFLHETVTVQTLAGARSSCSAPRSRPASSRASRPPPCAGHASRSRGPSPSSSPPISLASQSRNAAIFHSCWRASLHTT